MQFVPGSMKLLGVLVEKLVCSCSALQLVWLCIYHFDKQAKKCSFISVCGV